MLEVLKSAGRWPSTKNVVCSCWDTKDGYWYLVEDEPKLSLLSPKARGQHIVSRMDPAVMPVLKTGTQPVQKETGTRVCSLVDRTGLDLHWIEATFPAGSPGAEAICRRLVELLNGAK